MLKITHVTDHSKLRQHFENLEPDADVLRPLSYSPPGENEMNFYATSGRKIEFFYLSLNNPLAIRENKLLLPTPSPPPPDFWYYQNHPKINTYEDETPLQKNSKFRLRIREPPGSFNKSLCQAWLIKHRALEETIPISVQWQWQDNFKLGP